MHVTVRNVHHAYPILLDAIENPHRTVVRDSRNGPVRRFTEPVTIEYQRPTERVVFWPERDANPFFHLVEALWMLAGRNDVASMTRFVKRMADFSDDGRTFHGAYGYRWRRHFLIFRGRAGELSDQLAIIINTLRENPDDRRCVLQMWDAEVDLGRGGKDFPCNVMATFEVTLDGLLNMSVFNRSNDLIWGALGANAVHFSVLQEYMAAHIGVGVGKYYQISSNLHAYLNTLEPLLGLADHATRGNLLWEQPQPHPLVTVEPEKWDGDLARFWQWMDAGTADAPLHLYFDPFFTNVAIPMVMTHTVYKWGRGESKFQLALDYAARIDCPAWQKAAVEWIERRYNKWLHAADAGVSYES